MTETGSTTAPPWRPGPLIGGGALLVFGLLLLAAAPNRFAGVPGVVAADLILIAGCLLARLGIRVPEMETVQMMSPRRRLGRLVLGLGVTALGVAVYAYSKANDPKHRGALLGIVGVLFGLTYVGQGFRGHRETVVRAEKDPVPGDPVSAEWTAVALALGWVLPGLGHWVIRRRTKALLYFVTISTLFLAGVLLAEGRNMSMERNEIYFLAYMFNGGETLLAWLLAGHLRMTHEVTWLQVGFLYSAVACLLNVVVLMDLVVISARSARKEP